MPRSTQSSVSEANASAIQLLNDLDARQDELLLQLEQLEARIASVFDQWGIRMDASEAEEADLEPVEE